MMNHILCKTQTLMISWKHMVNTQQTWHPHIISQSTLLPLMGLWLVDRGANGGLVGACVGVVERTCR